jgi:uncharacterized membrane protein
MRSTRHRHALSRRNLYALLPFSLVLAVIGVPYLWQHGAPFAALVLSYAFSLVCHQHPERSFWLFGAPVAVCARCLGIYLGAAIGLLLRTSRRMATRLLIAAAAINLLDAFTELAGLHGNWLVVRFLLGVILGAAGALLITSSIEREAASPRKGEENMLAPNPQSVPR